VSWCFAWGASFDAGKILQSPSSPKQEGAWPGSFPWGTSGWDSPVRATSRMKMRTSTTMHTGMKLRDERVLSQSDFLVLEPGGGKSRRGWLLGAFPPPLPFFCRILSPPQDPARTRSFLGLRRVGENLPSQSREARRVSFEGTDVRLRTWRWI